jgi:uncharacterized membrane protein
MRRRSAFPFWGAIAIPAGALWGPLLGAGVGYLFGNPLIGAAIGAAIGVGVGLSLFAAAVVVASSRV